MQLCPQSHRSTPCFRLALFLFPSSNFLLPIHITVETVAEDVPFELSQCDPSQSRVVPASCAAAWLLRGITGMRKGEERRVMTDDEGEEVSCLELMWVIFPLNFHVYIVWSECSV